MRITLLGTGSADGWPNPFCDCSSCASERAAGRARRPSSALVDGRILIDAGPTTPHPDPGSGIRLGDVGHVLLTHGHPDHLQPAFLLSREWTHPTRPLHVWGPPGSIDLCRDWVGPDSSVTFHPVAAGDELALGTAGDELAPGTAGDDYRALVLPARHGHGNGDALADEAVLYLLTSPDGARLLYATDTGPFDPADVGLPREAVDVVLLDGTFGDTLDHGTGHLDLATLPGVVDALRGHGVIGSGTRVHVTHLSHHNPPTPELRARLAPLGVDVPDDLCVLDTERPAGRRTLVLGGVRSGKSHYAEQLLGAREHVTYVATGGIRPADSEWQARVAAHRDRRPSSWTTEETTNLVHVLMTADAPLLIDCLALWLTARLDHRDAWRRLESGAWQELLAEGEQDIAELAAAVAHCRAEVVLVSNEVGMGVVPPTAAGRLFADLLGRTNRMVAEACDDTVLLVAGRPLHLPAAHPSASRR